MRLSLLDRGLSMPSPMSVAARSWGGSGYEQGRLLQKRHSFTGLIAVTRGLVAPTMAIRIRSIEGG